MLGDQARALNVPLKEGMQLVTKRVYASTTYTPVQMRPGQRDLAAQPELLYPQLCFVIEDFADAFDSLVGLRARLWGVSVRLA